MRRFPPHVGVPAAFALLAYALALWQRPGQASSDTKIDLHVDPAGFLADVWSAWTPTGDLGHVASGQYAGYLWPMGPFFAAGDGLGLAPWLVHRLWLGTILAIGVVGVIHLVDALLGQRRAPARWAAGALFLLNPYVVTFANRTSITLLAYAALPWLLLCVHRGVRHPRSWWWPAVGALVLTSAGGGVNAAVIAWTLLGPLLLLGYEWRVAGIPGRDAAAFAWRGAVTCAAASVWWAVPVLVQGGYGTDFLQFVEQPGTIWNTTSASEVLRLMGYWVSYIGVGYTGELRPYFSDAGVLLFGLPVVVASLLVPAAAVAAFAWTHRWRYAPLALGFVLAGTLAVGASFPAGTPGRRALHFLYNHVESVQFLRTTYKAAPLVAIGLVLLVAAGAAAAWSRLRRPEARLGAAAAAALVLIASAWPLVRGEAVDSQLDWEAIPPAWVSAARDLDQALPADRRAVVLPGELFSFYDWGGTFDPILPTLAERPVAVRGAVPYADLRAVDLLWTTDALVQQQRLLPGQLRPLLDVLGAGAVVTAADTDTSRSGALGPAAAWAQLTGPGGLGAPDGVHGKVRAVPGPAGSVAPGREVPRVARWDVPAPGLVRVLPRTGATLLDGSADGVAALAAAGGLQPRAPLFYGADRTAADLRAAAAAGASVVITDSNRRRVYAGSRLKQNLGHTLTAGEPFSADSAVLNPVPDAGPAAQTVADYDGIRDVRAPYSPSGAQFPERRPFAALDGDVTTSWLADRALDPERRILEVLLERPRDVRFVDLLPHADARGTVTEVEIAGRRHRVRRGWNRLAVGLRDAAAVRVRLSRLERREGRGEDAGGIAELRIPGVRAAEWLRPPVVLERALQGADLRRSSLTYVLTRTTGDDPFRRSPAAGAPQARRTRDRGDAERDLARRIAPPAARRWRADGWVTVDPRAPDPALDALLGTSGNAAFESSGRFEGRPAHRASRAFDGNPRTAWVGMWLPGRRAALEWTAPRQVTVRRLELERPRVRVRAPTRVRLRADGVASPPVPVAADGTVVLPAALRGRRFRLEILAARFAPGTSGAVRRRRAVGIADVRGAGVQAPPSRRGTLDAGCGALRVGAGTAQLALRVVAPARDVEAGRPLRARGCAPASLPAGRMDVRTRSTLFLPAILRLESPAPAPPPPAAAAGAVEDPGEPGRASWTGVRVRVDAPGWLMLGESYSAGWRASCDGRDLGAPAPIGAYANAWPVEPGCRSVAFRWMPQRAVTAGYGFSAIACVALLAVVALGRRPRSTLHAPPLLRTSGGSRPPLPPRRAAGWALAAAALVGVLFALRAGAVAAPLLYLVLRRGTGARALTLLAAALLGVAVPAIYVLALPDDRGGYGFSYALDLLAAHWIAVAALVALAVALWRSLSPAPVPSPPPPPVAPAGATPVRELSAPPARRG